VDDAKRGERQAGLTKRVLALEKRVSELEAAIKEQAPVTASMAQSAPDQGTGPVADPRMQAPWPTYPLLNPRPSPQAWAAARVPPLQGPAGQGPVPGLGGRQMPGQGPAGSAYRPPALWGPNAGWPPASAPRVSTPGPSLADELGISIGSLRDLESRLTGRLLAWVGAAAVVLGAVFFLSLAFSRGWIGPEARVAVGLIGGAVFIGLGAWLLERRQDQLGHVVVAVGLGVVSLALFAGTRLYGLFPPETALAGSFAAALVAAAIAVRHDSEAVAIFGLVAVVAAPPVLGAGANLTTVLFLGLTLVGTTSIALLRSWRWLPPAAFVITAPQVVAWLAAGPQAGLAVAVLGGYWMLHALAAAADELRAAQSRVEGRAETLFVANSALAVGGGLYVLSGNLAPWQGAFVAAAALAQFAFGAYFVWRRGDRYPFGMLVNGIGIALVALAIERQFDGPAVALAWALEALVLVAVYRVRHHEYAGGAAVLLAGLPVAHLCWYEYPVRHWILSGASHASSIPFANPAGLTLGCLLAAGLAAAWLSRHHDARCALVTACLLLVAYSLPFELSGLALLAAWSILVPAAVAAEGLLDRLPGVPPSRSALRTKPISQMMEAGWPDAPLLATATAAFLAVAHLLAFDVPIAPSVAIVLPAVPFTDLHTVSAAVGIAAFLVAGGLTARPDLRAGGILVAAALAAFATIFELAMPFAVVVWCGLAVAVASCSLWDAYGRPAFLSGGAPLVGVALLATLGQVVPVERLGVQASVPTTGFWFAVYAICSMGAIAAALAAAAGFLRLEGWVRQVLALAAATAVVYLLSALLVDLFQGRVGGTTQVEELQKQAQVAVSIMWAAIGMVVFVVGIVRWRQLVREAGLSLLALATGKVFLFDLSYLDVAYRVLSLMGLGLLLLAGAYVYQLLRPRRPGSQGDAGAD